MDIQERNNIFFYCMKSGGNVIITWMTVMYARHGKIGTLKCISPDRFRKLSNFNSQWTKTLHLVIFNSTKQLFLMGARENECQILQELCKHTR